MEEAMEGGWLVRRPNFWVVQVRLLGLTRNARVLGTLRRWFKNSRCSQVRGKAAALSRELARLVGSKDLSDAKMFLNVAGGPKESEELSEALMELQELGVRATLAPGPLFMKTVGSATQDGVRKSVVLPMPLLVKSTYDFLGRVTRTAYEALVAEGGDPDLVLGKGRSAPRFAHHSGGAWQIRWRRNVWRRGSARVRTSSSTSGGD